MKPTIAAIRLKINLKDWNGTKLEEMLTDKKREALEVKKILTKAYINEYVCYVNVNLSEGRTGMWITKSLPELDSRSRVRK